MRKPVLSPSLLRVLVLCLPLSWSGCTGIIERLGGPLSDTELDRDPATPDDDGKPGGEDGEGNGPGEGLPDDVTPEQIANGGELYKEMCAGCHGADGLGGPFNVPLTRDMGFDKLMATIDATMPKGAPELCVGDCAHDVAAYIQATFVITGNGGTDEPEVVCTEERAAPRMLRLLTRREYKNTIIDLLGVAAPDTDNLPVEPRVKGFDNNAAAAVVTSRHVDEYSGLGGALAKAAVQNRKAALVPCNTAEASCAKTTIESLGLRAFRRPLSDEETSAYLTLFAPALTQGNFDTGLTLLLEALLISPNFLYRSEMGEEQPDGSFKLTPYETASLLSYTFVGSMPDAELLEAAAQNKLSTKAELAAQAERLLQDPRARTQVIEFVTQWLRTDALLSVNKDAQIYPTFNDGVREAMLEEQARLVEHLFFDSDGTFTDLFDADYVFVNQTLAQFYGVSGAGNGFAQVTLPAGSDRGGLLGLGAVMASHAHSNESSPIKRGLFVRDRLLCQDLPPPPANLDTTPPGLDPKLTTRERFAKHTADPTCKGCHQFIDGVGFGLEGFDGVGAARSEENGIPVDVSGSVMGMESLKDPAASTFDGARGLSKLVSESDSGKNCLPLQLYRFTRAYAESDEDRCSIEALQARFKNAKLSLHALLVESTQLDNLLVRQ